MNLGFIGAGNMAYAIAKSIKQKDKNNKIFFIDIDGGRVNLFKSEIDADGECKTPEELMQKSEIIFICIKPQLVEKILPLYGASKKLFVSILAGVEISKIKIYLPLGKVIRVMPNTPGLVSQMAAAICKDRGVTNEEFSDVYNLLSSAGELVEVIEDKFNAITGLSGSGPAFVARIIDYFSIAGVRAGLDESIAKKLALQTFIGTGVMLKELNMEPEKLIQMVSSPGGTTVAGREVLENSDVKQVIIDTVLKSKKRGEELGK